jgi:hypothetical protein
LVTLGRVSGEDGRGRERGGQKGRVRGEDRRAGLEGRTEGQRACWNSAEDSIAW